MQQPITSATGTALPDLSVRHLGMRDYEPVWRAMQHYTDQRDGGSEDQLWLVQHPPVFTQGQAGKAEHILAPGDIPIVQVDRGGQVTYHGPGQLVAYPLLDIERRQMGVRQLVDGLEQAIIRVLADYDIPSIARKDAPGVYVDGRKIASLGLRIRKGRTYHGLAFNIDMDLEPFSRINPCGFQGLELTQLSALVEGVTIADVEQRLCHHMADVLSYNAQFATTNEVDEYVRQSESA